MARANLPTAAAHALFACAFSACAVSLVHEGERLGGAPGRAGQAVGAAALGLALLSAWACARWLLSRAARVLPLRLGLGAYAGLLGLAFALALAAGHLWSAQARPALAAFAGCLAAAALCFGFGLVPLAALDDAGLLDALGRRLAWGRLERYALQRTEGEPPRHLLRLWLRGSAEPLALRLADEDATALTSRLDAAGLRGPSR